MFRDERARGLAVKLRLAAVFDAQHGGFATGWSPVSWGSIDELFVNLTMPGDVLSGHWSTSTSAGAAIVFLGDQSPVPTQDRIRGDDARDLRQDPPAEFVTAHSESTTLGVRQAKRPRAQVFSEDPILLPEIVDQIVLVTVHPASEREDEELQRRRHSLRLLGRLDQHRPSLGRFFAPYAVSPGA